MEKSIEEIARETMPRICILGLGGAGGNIVTWMTEKEAVGVKTIALDASAQDLVVAKADEKILLGYEVTGGLGCGGRPEVGSEAARNSLTDIVRVLTGSKLVFIAAGLGGGTGTGSAPIVAKAAKELGALTIGVVTLPFAVESVRKEKAKTGLKRLSNESDAVVVIDNNRLRKVAGSRPLKEAFAVANELIASFIKNLSETIAMPSLMNMDFADLRSIMVGGGVCAIGVGEGLGDTKVRDAVEEALSTQLLDITDISEAEGALIHVEGGDDMTLDDINQAAEYVLNQISPGAKASWGARVNNRMTGSVRVTLVLTGVSRFLVEPKPKKELDEIKGAIVFSKE